MAEAKKCSSCTLTKDISHFRRNYRTKKKEGYQSHCKDCERRKYREKYRERHLRIAKKRYWENVSIYRKRARESYYRNKEGRRFTDLLKNYGITEVNYLKLFNRQGGLCAICSLTMNMDSRKKNLSVDHCHKTKKVRGLLCNNCNSGLGFFRENPVLLEKAKKYLDLEPLDS